MSSRLQQPTMGYPMATYQTVTSTTSYPLPYASTSAYTPNVFSQSTPNYSPYPSTVFNTLYTASATTSPGTVRRTTRQAPYTSSFPVITTSSSTQATWSTYANRIKEGNTSLLLPAISRRRARAANANISYVEDSSDVDFDDDVRSNSGIATPGSRLPNAKTGTDDKIAQRRFMQKTKHVYKNHKEVERNAEQREVLIPIRLDIDFENYRLRDTFTWNLNEKLITPEDFAQILCNDLDIPESTFIPVIASSINSQIHDYEAAAEVEIPEEDNRVAIQIDVQSGRLYLRDRFEWDLGSDLTPEAFAKQLAADIGVGGEFAPLIAHNIREQLLRFKKERLVDGDRDQEPLTTVYRPVDTAEWAPILETLTPEELEKVVLDKERSIRRLRRENSRAGATARSRSLRPGTPRSSGLNPNVPSSPNPRKPEGKASRLAPEELEKWRCQHCAVDGHNTPLVRRGPNGAK
ncbi:10965_t:CDS:2, partial [Paraglomus brasilianum]